MRRDKVLIPSAVEFHLFRENLVDQLVDGQHAVVDEQRVSIQEPLVPSRQSTVEETMLFSSKYLHLSVMLKLHQVTI